MKAGSPTTPTSVAIPMRNTGRDGFKNRLEFFLLTNFRPVWGVIQAVAPLHRLVNRALINRAIYKTATRPYPFSLMSDYSSWASLTDRTFTGRHLPPKDPPGGPLPPVDRVVELFRRSGEITVSSKSTLLFSYFAQWFTDGFLRTDRADMRKNTSNHDIDLSPLYGLSSKHTTILRTGNGGRLKSQTVNGEEYPPYYFRNGQPADEFRDLPIIFPNGLDPARRDRLFACGADRANVQIGYVMLNTLFLREHNRVCGVLAAAHPDWDDERLFQTARNVAIVLLLKVVIDEYINHIAPYHFKFRLDAPVGGKEGWYRTNWMTVEFNLLYRWHGLVPDHVVLDGSALPMSDTLFNNKLVTDTGLSRMFDAASRQAAGEVGLANTPDSLLPTERASIEHARAARLATYNDYREHVGYPRVTRFDQITGDPERQERLRDLYESVDRVEFYVGLFAEDVRPFAAVGALIGRLVGIDAFSQALTNPLLATNIHNKATFGPAGLEVIASTRCLADIVRRNCPDADPKHVTSFTQLDWRR